MADLNLNLLRRLDVSMCWAAASHPGNVRKLNEDSYLALPGVFVIADGMGGHAAGEVASQLVVDEWSGLAATIPVAAGAVDEAIARCNRRVYDHAFEAGTLGMGTTLVAVTLISNGGEDALMVANVGDSRCYVLDPEGFRRVTHDHSVVQELVDDGSITEAEAAVHHERHVVTRAIGVERLVSADLVVLDRAPSQRLLLCSDGVSGQVTDAELAEVLTDAETPDDAVAEIIRRVLSGVANDNATAVVLDLQWIDRVVADDDAEITLPRAVLVPTSDSRPPVGQPAESKRSMGLIDSVPSFGSHPQAEGPADGPERAEFD